MKTKLLFAISAIVLASVGLHAQHAVRPQHLPAVNTTHSISPGNTNTANYQAPDPTIQTVCADKVKYVDRYDPQADLDYYLGGTVGWQMFVQAYPGYTGQVTQAFATLRRVGANCPVRIQLYALDGTGAPTGSPLAYVDATVNSSNATEYGGNLNTTFTATNGFAVGVKINSSTGTDSCYMMTNSDPDQRMYNYYAYNNNLYTGLSLNDFVDFELRPVVSFNAPTETVTATPSSGCPGTPINFSDAESGYPNYYQQTWGPNQTPTYNWTFGDAGTSTVLFPTHTYTTSGTYNVNFTVNYPGWTTGCPSSGTTTVSMNGVVPAVNVIATTTVVCVSDNVTFQANPTGGGSSPTYQWKKNGFNVGTGQTYSASGFVAGDQVQCVMTSNDPCASPTTATSNTITMAVQPGSISAFSYTATALIATFTNSAQNATSYLWDFGDSQTSTAPNPTHTYSGPGVYTVQLTTTNACGVNNASQLNVTVANTGNHSGSNVGIAEQTLSLNAQSYPNPAGNELNVVYSMQHNADITIEVVDALGQVVSSQQISGTSNGTATVSMENLAPGLYFVRLTAGNEQTMLRVAHQ